MKDKSKELELLLRKIEGSSESMIEVDFIQKGNEEKFKYYFQRTIMLRHGIRFFVVNFESEMYAIKTNSSSIESLYEYHLFAQRNPK